MKLRISWIGIILNVYIVSIVNSQPVSIVSPESTQKDSIYSTTKKQNLSESVVPYNKLLDMEFTKVLTGQNTNFGTFATLGTKDEIVTLAGHIRIKDQSNLGINITGGNSEGIVPLLNGEDVSTNIKLALQLNLGIYKTKNKGSILVDATEILNFKNTIDSLALSTKINRDKVDNLRNQINLDIEKKELESKQKSRNLEQLKSKKDALDFKNINPLKQDSINVLILSLELDILKLSKDIYYLRHQYESLTDDIIASHKQNLENIKNTKYKKEFLKLKLMEYDLNWFAIIASLDNRSFNQIITGQNDEYQVNQVSFNSFEIGASFNKYNLKEKPFGSYYFSFGLSFLYEDNFDELTKKTLVEKSEVSSAPNLNVIESTKIVYLGDYKPGISTPRIIFNSYWFIGYKRVFAFHFNPGVRIGINEYSKLDLIAGFLIGFNNQEKKNSIINAELFYNMKDIIHKSKNDNDQLSDRSNLGIKLSFPIAFNQKN